jgi:hypothetical protein
MLVFTTRRGLDLFLSVDSHRRDYGARKVPAALHHKMLCAIAGIRSAMLRYFR